MKRRTGILTAVMAAMLAVAALWCYGYMTDRRNAAIQAQNDLSDCRRYAAQISALQNRPAVASDSEKLFSETTSLIEQAAQSAGIKQIASLTPERPRRIEDSVYKETPTRVTMQQVTLKQLATMLYKLIYNQPALHAKSIRVEMPRGDEYGSTWDVEIVLTYLVYDPMK